MATTTGFAMVLVGVRWFRMARGEFEHREGSERRKWVLRRAAVLGFGLAWGVALSALTLLPFLHELSNRDILAARATDSSSHLDPINVFGLLTSEVPGPPARGPWWTNLSPYEGMAYLGLAAIAIVVLGLLLASLRRLRASSDGEVSFMFFSAVGVLVIVLSYIGTPLLALVYRVPGFANNPIWRTRFLIGFAAAVLVALTLDSVWRHRLSLVRNGSLLAWWSRATLVALVVIFIRFAPRFLDAAGGAAARLDLVRNGAIALGVLGVVLAAVRWRKLVVVAAAVTGVVIYLQLIVPGYDFTPAAPKSDFYTQQSGHRTLKRLTGDRFRYAASGHNFTWNTSDVFGTYDLRGVALHAPQFRKLMHEVSNQAFVPNPFNILLDRDAWNLASPVLDHLGVRYFALGTDEMPYGSPDRPVVAPASWAPIDADHTVELSTPVARIDGIVLPLRASGSCTAGSVRVRLTRGGMTTATSRPLHDVNGTPLAFAIKGPGPAAGGLTLQVDATDPGCNLELGVGADGSFAGAILTIDDASPVRLVSTNQGWIYERPSASPIVTSYGRWTRLNTQAGALDWLRNRPANETGEVPVVGDVPSSDSGQAAEVIESQIEDESVNARVQGETRSLVSTGQVVGDGWRAMVDGKESKMVLVDGGIMATPVPPGAHRVEFRYEPKTVRTGALLSGGAVIVAVAGLVTLALRRRRRSQPKPGHRAEVSAERVPGALEGSRGM
jgi:hypothetical protein